MPDTLTASDFDIGSPASGNDAKSVTPETRKQELSGLLKKLKTDASNEQKLFLENVDSEYWFCVCFQTREQKDEFLRKIGWEEIGDKYLDGIEVARRAGVKLSGKTPPVRKIKLNKRWRKYT